jgi:glycosyltransferase involved in cell wall biosynthesis
MHEPAVTVAMPVLNCEATVDAAVRSILHQTYTNWTLLVIEDGSTDATLQRLERLATDRRICVCADGRSLGLAARLNQAIEVSDGAYFARMDGDDVAYPERLERQVALLESEPEVDLVGAPVLVFGTHGQVRGWRPVPTTHAGICARPRSGFGLAHPTWCGRQRWFEKHRYDLRAIRCEDQDLLRRTWRHSRFANVPQILLGYWEPDVNLAKVLRTRLHCVASVARDAGGWLRAESVISAAEQAAKGLADTAAVVLGSEHLLLGHRHRSVSHTERIRWEKVWSRSHEP